MNIHLSPFWLAAVVLVQPAQASLEKYGITEFVGKPVVKADNVVHEDVTSLSRYVANTTHLMLLQAASEKLCEKQCVCDDITAVRL